MAIPRINVLDYGALGRKFIEWATNPETRPKDLDEFARQLRGVVDPLPSYIKSLMFVQATKDILLIRLPPADLVEDSLTVLGGGGNYPLPSGLQAFYRELLAGNKRGRASFEFRVGDYIIAHCA